MKSIIVKSSLVICCAATITHANEWAGTISAQDVRTRVGETPVIEWSVTYPVETPEDVVEICDGVIKPKTDLKMEVRLLGAAWSTSTRYYQVFGRLYHNDDRTRLFLGYHDEIDPIAVVHEKLVEPGDSIMASAKGSYSETHYNRPNRGWWTTHYKSWETTPNVVLLKNGDDAPQLSAAYSIQKSVDDHLAPYMNPDTGKMVLGPRDLVYLFDFNDYGTNGYDLQDFCVLITFQDVEPANNSDQSDNGFGNGHNNGHGNNADDVDVSNPGVGDGGPSGTTDTDYDGDGTYEDDENSSSSAGQVGW